MKGRVGAAFIASTLALVAPQAHAGGLFIPGAGPQAQARAGAFVAKADDTTAMFHNPAGLMKGTGWVVQLGVNMVGMSLEYQRFGVYEQPVGETVPYAGQPFAKVTDKSKPALGIGGMQAIPTIGFTTDFGLQKKGIPIRFGFSIMAPQAYPERNFDNGYQFEADPNAPPPPQRYDVITQQAVTVLPTVAVGYQVTKDLDVGVRFSSGFAELKGQTYVWGIANYEEWIARDGVFNVDVSDSFVPGYGVGVLYRPTRNLEIGASYSSALTIEATGRGGARLGSDLGLGPGQPDMVIPENDTPACAAGGTDQDNLKACLSFKIPQTASIGARYILRDSAGGERADLEFDVKWENWADASDITVIVDGKSMTLGRNLEPSVIRHQLMDVFSFRLGGSYTMPVGKNALSIRAGAAYDTKTAKASFNRVDLDSKPRMTLAGGVAYTFGRFRVEAGGGIVIEPDRVVPDNCQPTISVEGCQGNGEETRVPDRTRPDPVQPLSAPLNQIENPFNAGEYKSGYVLLHLGVTAWF